jgi:hypothetical protein
MWVSMDLILCLIYEDFGVSDNLGFVENIKGDLMFLLNLRVCWRN